MVSQAILLNPIMAGLMWANWMDRRAASGCLQNCVRWDAAAGEKWREIDLEREAVCQALYFLLRICPVIEPPSQLEEDLFRSLFHQWAN